MHIYRCRKHIWYTMHTSYESKWKHNIIADLFETWIYIIREQLLNGYTMTVETPDMPTQIRGYL